MFTDILRTAREEYSRRTLVLVAALGVFAFVFDVSREMLVGLVVAVAFSQAFYLLLETPSVDTRYVKSGMGGVILVGSAVMGYDTATGGEGAAWFPILTTFVSVWILLDAVYDFRHGTHTRPELDDEEFSPSEMMLLTSQGNLLVEELKDGPRTASELAAACDLTESRTRDSLDLMERSDIVYQRSHQYVLDNSEVGPIALARNVFRRTARPFRGLLG